MRVLARQCDVVLVDRYGLPYRLGKEQPLVVGAHEAVGCIEGITFIQGLEDGSGIALRLPVSKRCAGHDLRGHEAQADSCDRLRGGQQREGLRVEDAGPNKLVNAITESMGCFARQGMQAFARLGGCGRPRGPRLSIGVSLVPLS